MDWKKPMKGVDVENQLHKLTYPKFVQPKYDGIRVLFYNGIALSSSFKPLGNEKIQQIAREFSMLEGVECEYYIQPSDGGFREATSICRNANRTDIDKGGFYAFDLFNPTLNYTDRLFELGSRLNKVEGLNIYIAPTWKITEQQEVNKYLQFMLDNKFEGIMIKDPTAKYKQGRSTIESQECLKLKPFVDDDAVVIGWKPEYENTNEAYIDELGRTVRSSAQAGKYAKELVGALQCRCIKYQLPFWVSGFTMEQKEAMWLTRDKLVGRKLCFKHQPCGCYDAPRHPIFRRWI